MYERDRLKVIVRPGYKCVVVGVVSKSGTTRWATATEHAPIPDILAAIESAGASKATR